MHGRIIFRHRTEIDLIPLERNEIALSNLSQNWTRVFVIYAILGQICTTCVAHFRGRKTCVPTMQAWKCGSFFRLSQLSLLRVSLDVLFDLPLGGLGIARLGGGRAQGQQQGGHHPGHNDRAEELDRVGKITE